MNIATLERKHTLINMMPLIDVVFLLLLFFMLSTSFKQNKVMEITLPKATNTKSMQEKNIMHVYIGEKGEILLEGMPLDIQDRRSLYTNLADLKTSNVQPVVILADKQTPYQYVITMMDALAEVGFSQIKLQTQNESSKK